MPYGARSHRRLRRAMGKRGQRIGPRSRRSSLHRMLRRRTGPCTGGGRDRRDLPMRPVSTLGTTPALRHPAPVRLTGPRLPRVPAPLRSGRGTVARRLSSPVARRWPCLPWSTSQARSRSWTASCPAPPSWARTCRSRRPPRCMTCWPTSRRATRSTCRGRGSRSSSRQRTWAPASTSKA